MGNSTKIKMYNILKKI